MSRLGSLAMLVSFAISGCASSATASASQSPLNGDWIRKGRCEPRMYTTCPTGFSFIKDGHVEITYIEYGSSTQGTRHNIYPYKVLDNSRFQIEVNGQLARYRYSVEDHDLAIDQDMTDDASLAAAGIHTNNGAQKTLYRR